MNSDSREQNISVGIVGASGYIGVELLALIESMPNTQLKFVTSRENEGQPIDVGHDSRLQTLDALYTHPDKTDPTGCDAVFFATPAGICAQSAQKYIDAGCVVFDLSGDHRLLNKDNIVKWYGEKIYQARSKHGYLPVYGLPEWNQTAIQQANLISCPGCYVTTSLLPLLPLLKQQLISNEIIIDAKSGVSGAGKTAETRLMYGEISENFSPYNMQGHRHTAEIFEKLQAFTSQSCRLVFTPQLLPVRRGLMSMMYVKSSLDNESPPQLASKIRAAIDTCYQDYENIVLLAANDNINLRAVQYSNKCIINVYASNGLGHSYVTIVSVLDNLQKGAASQALQNLNLRFKRPINYGLN